MKKYKTWEAIAMLEKNPKLRFKSYGDTLYASKYGYIMFEREGYSKDCPAGRFEGNVNLNKYWELIQQPVDFLTAVKAYSEGKTIRCEIGNNEPSFYSREVAISVLTGKKIYGSTCLIDNHGGTITTEEILEGTWYVEDSYENH